jgi:hypothetical protein
LDLNDRIEAIADDVAKREEAHADAIGRAWTKAEELHGVVDGAIERFNATVGERVPYLRVEVSPPRIDDKHLHAVEFELSRGRHRGVVTVKSKGEVTVVGPFRAGKQEGPCRSFPFDATDEIDDALGDFLERFLQEAVSP